MRAYLVVVPTPILQFFPSIFKTHEPVGGQAFCAEAPVEDFDEGVLDWLAGRDVVLLDLRLLRLA